MGQKKEQVVLTGEHVETMVKLDQFLQQHQDSLLYGQELDFGQFKVIILDNRGG